MATGIDSARSEPRSPASPPPASQTVLLEVVRGLLRELHSGDRYDARLSLNSSLERDLGIDSLARAELLVRIERRFGIALPDRTLERAETPLDLLRALQDTQGRGPSVPDRGGPTLVPPSAPIDGEPRNAATLLDVLDWHVRAQPQRTEILYIGDAGQQAISNQALREAAQCLAAGLQARGLEPGETVAIMLPTSPEYFYTYVGVLLAGGIPVPIYPPARLSQIEEHTRRHAGILTNARVGMLVTVREARAVAQILRAHAPSIRAVVTPQALMDAAAKCHPVAIDADSIAFIQYTSGSTGDPKGVVLSHRNLLANIRAMGALVQVKPDDVFVSWLPLYHDMGLIGAWLGSMYYGMPLVVMSPLAFLARPSRWLRAMHEHRGTISAGPNFAYELCVKRIDDSELAGVDLSCWRLAFNGAEAVIPETLRRFAARFAKFGLRAEALTPVYGLAEASVGLAFPPLGRGPLIECIDRQSFAQRGHALPAHPDDPHPLQFVSCGHVLPGHALRIVDAGGAAVAERTEGRIEFTGPSATRGYFRNAEGTAKLFHGEWLDSGDRGYLANGELFVTGRMKDIIIRGGRNIYPHEIEEAVGEVPGVRKGCVAVFGSPDPRSGTERLIVLAETRQMDPAARATLRETINRAVVATLGEPADEIVLAAPHVVLKTSSGKIRRAASRTAFERGVLDAAPRDARWQLMRLGFATVRASIVRSLEQLVALTFGVYAWIVFLPLAAIAWVLTALVRSPRHAWAVAHYAARILFRLTATPVTVRGPEHLRAGERYVLVANHASYLDGAVIAAASRQPLTFVAKREFVGQPIPRVFLRGIGAELVERFAAGEGVKDTEHLERVARDSPPLAFFPEGTFVRAAGLRPFRLGAFVIAAHTGLPIVPVAIHGTRAILRAHRWLPAPGSITVTIGAAILPVTDGRDAFGAAIALRDCARAHILAHCGESDAALERS